MPYHRQTSGTHLHPNHPLASVLRGGKTPNSARITKNFVTKPKKSPNPAANPHRICKRLFKKPQILGFDMVNSQVWWPFSQVRWAQNRPNEPDRTRPRRQNLDCSLNAPGNGSAFPRAPGNRSTDKLTFAMADSPTGTPDILIRIVRDAGCKSSPVTG
jgi:hypothetical protein